MPKSVPLPRMDPYSRHVLICVGAFCTPDSRGRALYELLPALLQREGLLFGPGRVKRGRRRASASARAARSSSSTRRASGTRASRRQLLERIVVEHLRDGRVVEEAVFHRLSG